MKIMITGTFFLKNVEDQIDLKRLSDEGVINAEEYKTLKMIAKYFVDKKFYAFYDWNKGMANNLKGNYIEVLKRMREIENES